MWGTKGAMICAAWNSDKQRPMGGGSYIQSIRHTQFFTRGKKCILYSEKYGILTEQINRLNSGFGCPDGSETF